MLDLQESSRSSLEFYRMGKVIGEGSFAKVRSAWHKLTGQQVAVKTYEKSNIKASQCKTSISRDPQQWKRITQEIKLMERLSHAHLIRLFETVSEAADPFNIILE
ncbi:unnamed protein product [Choristocarpus tenellus]